MCGVVDALCETGGHISMHYLITGTLFVRRLLTTADGGMDTGHYGHWTVRGEGKVVSYIVLWLSWGHLWFTLS